MDVDLSPVGVSVDERCRLLPGHGPGVVAHPANLVGPQVLEHEAPGFESDSQALETARLNEQIHVVMRPGLPAEQSVDAPASHQPDRNLRGFQVAIERYDIGSTHCRSRRQAVAAR